MSLFFSRHTKVFLEQGTNVWEVPVMDGFSFSQATNSSEVTLNEMEASGGGSRRGRAMFNDSYAPAEWSFSTYVRPFTALATSGDAAVTAAAFGYETTNAHHHCVEEALWANFIAPYSTDATWNPPLDATSSAWPTINTFDPVTYGTGATGTVFDFSASNSSIVGVFNLYFVLGYCEGDGTNTGVYKVEGCVVNSASIDFEIDGISTISWSGMGNIISDEDTTVPATTLLEGIIDTDNFIRNRLTTLAIVAHADYHAVEFQGANTDGKYNLTITGGNISFENNITFLTPETLCSVNQPIGHVTGTRNVSGNFTSYLSTGTAGDSGSLFDDLISATEIVTNSFALDFSIGGAVVPKLEIALPNCHLEVPAHSIEDVISVEVNFHGLPTDLDTPDEASITYTGT